MTGQRPEVTAYFMTQIRKATGKEGMSVRGASSMKIASKKTIRGSIET